MSPVPPRPAVAARRSWQRELLLPALAAAGVGAGLALLQAALTTGIDALLPDASRIASYNRPGTLTVLDSEGQVIYREGPVAREKLPSGHMPQLLQRAFVAAEDRRFYLHDGVDPVGIGRAMLRNLRQGSVEEGASTITQQLARTVYLDQDRTLLRKLKEAALAGKIERQLSKNQILEQYLNYVYLGSGAYGVSDAAWVYFSKSPDQLTLPEAALIAGLPPAPSVYSPLVNPEYALSRRATVLRRMREIGYIDDRQLEQANAAPLGLKPADPQDEANPAPWFISWMEQELPTVVNKERLELGGLTVRTSLNRRWQKQAQRTIQQAATGGLQGALVSMEPGTGLVRAMVGGTDWNTSQFNRATQALRSPGSTFKLFTYTAALAAGLKPESMVSNQSHCKLDGTVMFCIPGKGGTYTLAEALARSMNAAAVATAEKVGYPRVIEMARKLGISGTIGAYPSMVLGANEKTVLEMTAAYAAINNRGLYAKPSPFEEIYGPNGELLWSRRVDGQHGQRAVSSDVADAVSWMLQGVVKNGTGYAASLPDRPVAGKTGTAEGARDLWFIGSIPQLTTGVWLGYDQNLRTHSSSAQAAAAWATYMTAVVKELPPQPFPPKPELTGTFQPYKPSRSKERPSDNSRPPEDLPAPELQPWEPPRDRTPIDPVLPDPQPRQAAPTTDVRPTPAPVTPTPTPQQPLPTPRPVPTRPVVPREAPAPPPPAPAPPPP